MVLVWWAGIRRRRDAGSHAIANPAVMATPE
jgi:hypothetical protein